MENHCFKIDIIYNHLYLANSIPDLVELKCWEYFSSLSLANVTDVVAIQANRWTRRRTSKECTCRRRGILLQ